MGEAAVERPEQGGPISVLVVDDHVAFGEAITVALRFEDDLTALGAVPSVNEAMALLERQTPDVVLMDIDLPGTDGLEGTRMIKQRYPEVHVLLLTGHTQHEYVERGAEAGAAGFLPKQTPMAEIIRAIRTASEGEMLIPASMLATIIGQRKGSSTPATGGRHASLTERELEVLELLGKGRDARGIARDLTIEVSTVRGHIKSILRKLNAHSQLEAVVMAAKRGLIDVVG